MLNRLILLATLMLSGCSTHYVNLTYKGHHVIQKTPIINKVTVYDERGTDKDWLGAIRHGWGGSLKTLRTKTVTSDTIKGMYIDALKQRNLYTSDDQAPYRIVLTLMKVDASQYVNREATASIKVDLLNNIDSKVVFSQLFDNYQVSDGNGFDTAFFGNVGKLRLLAEETINQTIDKSIENDGFTQKLMK
ncbi:hypothetical protein [Photobacterium swingsii]|uniref:hypothetical protein n=1 Tax=Photobacterium swingsii TaxID=680026 RepID=UPI00406909F3